MPTAQARICTDRAERYLTQLCTHLDQLPGPRLGHGGPPDVRHVEHTSEHGEITFGWGRCSLDATADALTIDLMAGNTEALRHGQARIGHRLQTIGRREGLEVTWQANAQNG